MLGILKNKVFCPDPIGYKIDYDYTNYLRIKLLKLNHFEVLSFINPKIYSLHYLLGDKAIGTQDEFGSILKLPPVIILNFNIFQLKVNINTFL